MYENTKEGKNLYESKQLELQIKLINQTVVIGIRLKQVCSFHLFSIQNTHT